MGKRKEKKKLTLEILKNSYFHYFMCDSCNQYRNTIITCKREWTPENSDIINSMMVGHLCLRCFRKEESIDKLISALCRIGYESERKSDNK